MLGVAVIQLMAFVLLVEVKKKSKVMLTPRLTDCVECTSIPVLLEDIECKIKDLAKDLYNNIIFSLNRPISGTVMFDLLNYRRILIYKVCNPDYASCYTVEMIASKIKLLKFK